MSIDLINPGNLVFLAAAIQAAAMLFHGQICIRILLLVGSLVYVTYYMNAADEPLWEAMIATLALSIANAFGLMAHVLKRVKDNNTNEQIAILSILDSVEPSELSLLMKYGQIRQLADEELLRIEGNAQGKLYFLMKGKIELEQVGSYSYFPPKRFIGETSLVLGIPVVENANECAEVLQLPGN